jgi:hypothetical protein
MKFGVFYELQLPKPWDADSERRVVHEALDQVELADRLGYDYAWCVEHHFLEEYSHCSAPEVFLSAAAARTKRIRLGHGIRQVIPNYNHPARTVEGLGMLDLVSNGRLDFGIGEGAMGVLIRIGYAPFALEVILRAMAPFVGLSFSIAGSQYIFNPLVLSIFVPLQIAYAFGLILLLELWLRQQRRAFVLLAMSGVIAVHAVTTHVTRQSRAEADQHRQAMIPRTDVTIRVADKAADGREVRSVQSHPIEVEIKDSDGVVLAVARSDAESGEFLPTNPRPDAARCLTSEASTPPCRDAHARWCGSWVPRIYRANVKIGDCRLFNVHLRRNVSPQVAETSTPEKVELLLTIDSRDCSKV